jgi:epoxyqueuosine reductase
VQTHSSKIEDRIKDEAKRLGFDLVGIARASESDGFTRLQEWLARGFAGEMAYMHRYGDARRHPQSILENVRSVIMVGMKYRVSAYPTTNPASSGKVARYAQGPDYHDVLRHHLQQLLLWIQQQVPDCHGRGVVDTAPLLERDFARRAGLGWFGKNTMLIDKHQGSFFVLGALLVDIDLKADLPHEKSHCGTCTRCLDACPTQAFTGCGWLDARKCISYLTIELRTSIPEELRSGMGDWLFGCDVCQEVCPWNRKSISGPTSFPHRSDLESMNLIELLDLNEEEFRQRFQGTPLTRSKRRGLLRNAAIVLGNVGDERALPILRQCLEDPEPLIREAAQWAIPQIEVRMKDAKTGTLKG